MLLGFRPVMQTLNLFADRKLVERNFHFRIAAGGSGVYGGCYALKVLSQNARIQAPL
jgi:hypothetical protein